MISNAINSDLMVFLCGFLSVLCVFLMFFDLRNMSLKPAPVPHKFCIEFLSNQPKNGSKLSLWFGFELKFNPSS